VLRGFERRQLRRGQGRAEPGQLVLLPREVLLALGALVGRGVLGGGLGRPRGLRVIRRQGSGKVLDDAPKELWLVAGRGGGFVGEREEKVGFRLAMGGQDLRRVLQLLGDAVTWGSP